MSTPLNKLPVTTIKLDTILQDAVALLQKIRPEWTQPNLKKFEGGLMNTLVGIHNEQNEDDMILFKLYGDSSDLLFDRTAEASTLTLLNEKEFGPKLHLVFENGLAYQYFPGTVLTTQNCGSSQIFPLVAHQMACLHSKFCPTSSSSSSSSKNVGIWKMLRKCDALVKEVLCQNHQLKLRLNDLGFPKEEWTWTDPAITELTHLIEAEGMPISFCHNDLLLANIVLKDDRSKVFFIDYEYVDWNYTPFDIANHFNEFAGVEDPDYGRCPNDSFKRIWITEYLNKDGENGHKHQIDLFMSWVKLCQPLSHLLWTLVCVVQAHFSKIEFDFAYYASLRFKQYRKGIQAIRFNKH